MCTRSALSVALHSLLDMASNSLEYLMQLYGEKSISINSVIILCLCPSWNHASILSLLHRFEVSASIPLIVAAMALTNSIFYSFCTNDLQCSVVFFFGDLNVYEIENLSKGTVAMLALVIQGKTTVLQWKRVLCIWINWYVYYITPY